MKGEEGDEVICAMGGGREGKGMCETDGEVYYCMFWEAHVVM